MSTVYNIVFDKTKKGMFIEDMDYLWKIMFLIYRQFCEHLNRSYHICKDKSSIYLQYYGVYIYVKNKKKYLSHYSKFHIEVKI